MSCCAVLLNSVACYAMLCSRTLLNSCTSNLQAIPTVDGVDSSIISRHCC